MSDPQPFPVELSTLRWGAPDARPAALLLHGLTSSAGTWWQVASALADAGWSVTAPDLRGHGASPRTRRYALTDYAADVADLRPASIDGSTRAWDLVVGHSLGGATAVVTADAHPDWARALLLLDPVFELPDADRPAVLADLLGDLDVLDPAVILRSNPRWHTEDAVQKANAARVVSSYVVERTLLDNPHWNLDAAAAGLRVPVQVLAADEALGAMFTGARGDRIARQNPGFTVEVVEGAAHSVQRDDPQRVIDAALATSVV